MTLSHTYRLLVAALLGTILVQPVAAQSTSRTSSDAPHFHEAAQQYLDGALQQALATVNEGLRADPGNPRLQALREKIQQQREQSSNPEDDEAEQDQSQNAPSSSQQDDTEQQSDTSNSEQDDASSDPQQEEDERSFKDATQGDPSSSDPEDEERSAPEDAQQQDGGENESEKLSRAQAARILRALESQEMQLLREVQKRTPRSRRIEKEW